MMGVASLTINSYRWSFVSVVAYSILWQLFSSKRILREDLPSTCQAKSKSVYRPSIMRAFVIVMTIVPRPTATPIDQSINPFIITFIVARRSKQEVHQLPRFRPPFSSISNKLANIAYFRLANEPPRRSTHQKRWPIRRVVSSVDEDRTTAEEIWPSGHWVIDRRSWH